MDEHSPQPQPPSRAALGVIFLTVFIDLIGFGMVLPLLPVYAKHFTADQTGVLIGLLLSSFSAMQFLFAPWWGRLSDRIGRRPVLMIGLAGSVVFYTIFGLATVWQSMIWLFVSRIGAGIAGATIPTAQAYIADVTSLANRARGMALVGAAFGLGFTFGPLFAYAAVPGGDGAPGAGPGYLAAGLSAIALVFAYFALPESLTKRSEPATHGWKNFAGLRAALGIPSIGLLLLATFANVLAFANFESTISLVLHLSRENNFREILMIFVFIGVVALVAQGGLVRTLARYLPEAVMAAGGAVLELVSFALLAQTTEASPPWMLWTGLGLVVTGFAFVNTSLNSLISRRSDPAQQGAILGVAQSTSALARILGPIAGVILLERVLTTAPMWLGSGVMVAALVLILVAVRRGSDFPAEAVEA